MPEPQDHLPTDQLAFRPREVCLKLGISEGHYYNLLRRGEIRVIHIGGTTRVPAAELARLASEGTTPADDYARQRVIESCRAQNIPVVPPAHILEAASAILATAPEAGDDDDAA